MTNCTFTSNTASFFGGGMFNNGVSSGTSSPSLTNCTFSSNTASVAGAGMFNDGQSGGTSNPTLTNCTFTSNTANSFGGGMFNNGQLGTSSPTLTNCTFSSNTANSFGGGMFNNGVSSGTSSPSLTHCTFSFNIANSGGGGMYNDANPSGTSNPVIRNCIFWGGIGNSWFNNNTSGATPDVAYTLVQEASLPTGSTDSGNNKFNENPLFTSGTDLILQSGSPAIDAGNNTDIPAGITTDLAGNNRIFNTTVDMGAYEFGSSPPLPPLSEAYVSTLGSDANTGDSFTNAFATLQKALERVASGSKIYVATGTYYPSVGIDFDDPANGIQVREVIFQIPDGVEVYGGFAGTETTIDLSARDFTANPTILSGDIGITGDDTDNAYHVVYTKNVTNATIVDGFTITAGNADGGFTPNNAGGGWYNDGSEAGNESSPTIGNVRFVDNNAGIGGGFYNNGENGGIANPSLSNCVFLRNVSNNGGGMYNRGVTGGTTNPSLSNCTFVSNTDNANNAGGMHSFGSGGTAIPQIRNCIFWGNTSTIAVKSVSNNNANANIDYSLVQEANAAALTGSTVGANMIYATDPLFTSVSDLTLQSGSPAIDAGNNAAIPAGITTDLAGNLRIHNTTVDMGVYEFTPPLAEAYVSTSTGSDANTGDSFTNAFATLQKALESVASGSKIYVAAGTYTPSVEFDFDGGGSDLREVTFQIPDGVEVYGGFAGTETTIDLSARDFTANPTILSGDIGTTGDDTDNAYHVVYTKNVTNTTIIDGFTIQEGNADGSFPNECGGGWYNDGSGTGNSSNPTLQNITFSSNTAVFGAGICNDGNTAGNSNPTLTHCTFSSNTATTSGGGMFNDGRFSGESSPSLTHCTFSSNTANNGAGMFNDGETGTSSPSLTHCTFSSNTASSNGAGMFNDGKTGTSSPSLTNCTFSSNTASFGGGILNAGFSGGESSPTLTHCTFSSNTAGFSGGGIMMGAQVLLVLRFVIVSFGIIQGV